MQSKHEFHYFQICHIIPSNERKGIFQSYLFHIQDSYAEDEEFRRECKKI